jgi:hypothetical protein
MHPASYIPHASCIVHQCILLSHAGGGGSGLRRSVSNVAKAEQQQQQQQQRAASPTHRGGSYDARAVAARHERERSRLEREAEKERLRLERERRQFEVERQQLEYERQQVGPWEATPATHSDAKVANRNVRFTRGDRKWPLSDGQTPNPNAVRVAPGPRYHSVEGNRWASRTAP